MAANSERVAHDSNGSGGGVSMCTGHFFCLVIAGCSLCKSGVEHAGETELTG